MTDAIEAGARAIYENWANYPACSNSDPWSEICEHRSGQADDFRRKAKACIEAAIASGALVPASAVAEMRERCADAARKAFEDAMANYTLIGPDGMAMQMVNAIRQLDIAPASGDYVVGWRDISTAPHETYILLGWWDEGKWNCETGLASHGWRRNGVSNMSMHSQATHWKHLPDGPPLHAATRTGGEK